jgi:hypothetical protein
MLCPFPSLALDPAARVDPYRFVHKAIRAMLVRLVEAAAKTDFDDDSAFTRLQRDTVDAVHLLRTHADIEVRFLDSLLGPHAHATNGVQREHAGLDAELFGVLEQLDLAVAEYDPKEMRARGHAFYLRLTKFVAHYFLHMVEEEVTVLPLLHAHVDEIVLRRALLAAQASLPYAERAKMYVLVLDAITRNERDALVASGQVPWRRAVDPRAVIRSGVLERDPVEDAEPALYASNAAGALQRS